MSAAKSGQLGHLTARLFEAAHARAPYPCCGALRWRSTQCLPDHAAQRVDHADQRRRHHNSSRSARARSVVGCAGSLVPSQATRGSGQLRQCAAPAIAVGLRGQPIVCCHAAQCAATLCLGGARRHAHWRAAGDVAEGRKAVDRTRAGATRPALPALTQDQERHWRRRRARRLDGLSGERGGRHADRRVRPRLQQRAPASAQHRCLRQGRHARSAIGGQRLLGQPLGQHAGGEPAAPRAQEHPDRCWRALPHRHARHGHATAARLPPGLQPGPRQLCHHGGARFDRSDHHRDAEPLLQRQPVDLQPRKHGQLARAAGAELLARRAQHAHRLALLAVAIAGHAHGSAPR